MYNLVKHGIILLMANAQYIRIYRDKRKLFAYEVLGNKCANCGTTSNLEFDHIDPETKTAKISDLWTSSITTFLTELTKCQLLCKDCHISKSITNGDYLRNRVGWQHGVSGYINQKCRCNVCKDAYSIYRKDRWAKNKI